MNSIHKIKVELVENEGKQAPTEVSQQTPPTQPRIEKEKSFLQKYAVTQLAVNTLKNVGYGMASRIGDITGDYQLQNQINNATKIIGIGIGFAINPIVGAASLATEIGFSVLDEYVTRRSANTQANYLKDITGTSATSGSRYRGRAL